MPATRALCLALITLSISSFPSWMRCLAADEPAAEPVYELRIYTCEPGKLAALNERFRDYTMELFARHGIENVAYWVPSEEPASATTLIYLVRHQSRAAADKSWAAFAHDPQWKEIVKQWDEKYGKLLAKAPESVYLAATDYSPKTGAAQQDHLYELRIYTAAEGKLEALHDRFRQHTDKLFQKHNMRSIGYWRPLDEPKSTNVLIYVLEHKDLAAAQASWEAFRADAEWLKAKQASEVNGPLTAERPQVTYMKPTPYSPSK